MIPSNEGALLVLPAATSATNASQTMSFDCTGYEHANVYVLIGTHATNGETIRQLRLAESDTVTSATSMTAIVAFTGGTVTSTSAGFTTPGAATVGTGSIVEFQVDLRKRKKYLGLVVTPGTTTMNIAAMARLTRSKESADTAAEKSGVVGLALASTSATQCAKIVTG
jgi:hypothetical protein